MKKINLLLINIVFCYSELSLLAGDQEKKQIMESNLPKNIYALVRGWGDVCVWKSGNPPAMTVENVANTRELNKFLMNKGNLEVRDKDGNSLLIIASQVSNKEDLVKYLLNSGANVNAVNKMGRTALWNAVYHRNPETVRVLLDYGANIGQDSLNHAETMFVGQKNRSGREFEEHKFKGWQKILNLLQYYPEYLKKRKQGELQEISFDDYLLARKVGEELKQGQYLIPVLDEEVMEYLVGPKKARDIVD